MYDPAVPNSSQRPEGDARSLLAAVVDSSDDAIFATDLEGVILTWNRGAEEMYGYSAAEIVGQSIGILIPDDRRDELVRTPPRIKAGERIQHQQTVRRTKEGRLIDVSVSLRPLRDGEGRIVGASATVRDVTEQKRVERALKSSEAHWRSVIESAVDGIIVIDQRGIVQALNPAAERLFGYAAAEVVGRNVRMLMPSPYHEEHDAYLQRYLETGQQRIIGIGREVTGLRKDGSTFPVHLAVGEMLIEGERKFTGILHDLTARVAMEERLREQSALTKLGEMAAVVAHEVKNPLTGIRGAIQVIGTRLPPGGKDAAIAREIVARLDALNELMKDMLLFARPPQPKIAHVNVVALVETVTHLVCQDPSTAGLHVELSGTIPPVPADPELLKIVLQNLLINASHAMDGQGTIRISTHVDGDGWRILVADEGPGIPPEVRDRLFTPFFTTKARGTGLGLSTAKRLVEALGGSIDLECPPSGGTVVSLRFPAQAVSS